MRRAERGVERRQRVVRGDGLLVEDVDRGRTGTAARQRAASTPGEISPERDVLTSSADGFIASRSAAVTIPLVSSVSLRCS